MEQMTVSRAEFISGVDDLLDRFKEAGGDPAFLIFTWVVGLAPAHMDGLADVMSEQRDRLRANAVILKKASRAIESIRKSAELLRGLGFNVAKFLVDSELGQLERSVGFLLNERSRSAAAPRRLGPRPERMRYLVTAALAEYLATHKIGNVAWRWEFIGDWLGLVSSSPDYVRDAAGLDRFIAAVGLEKRRLDRGRLRQALPRMVPSKVKVLPAMDLKRWYETRAIASADDLARGALRLGRDYARSWPR